jgi:hypothetical protein
VWLEVDYFDPRTPKNNPFWRTKWFYAKDQSAAGQTFGLKEFRVTSDLRPRVSWGHVLTEEEMATTEPLMQKIAQLQSTPRKEVTSLQLTRTFIEHRIQPLVVHTHCIWDYSGRKDPTRLSSDELKDVEIDDVVCVVTTLTKKSTIPKEFRTEPFNKACPRAKVNAFLKYSLSARIGSCVCCYFLVKLIF